VSAKRRVEFDGKIYAVKNDKIEIPDLASLDRIAALIWLNQNTYKRGHTTRKPNPLAGLGDAINVRTD
jgi:hypothetical protein